MSFATLESYLNDRTLSTSRFLGTFLQALRLSEAAWEYFSLNSPMKLLSI